jgi:hypothetical protein
MTMIRSTLLAFLVCAGVAPAAELAVPVPAPRKEPAYHTKAPLYALLVLGPETKDRVWLVHDGDTLYVDRNGDGDLREAGKRVTARVEKDGSPEGRGYHFDAGEIGLGGRVHRGLTIQASPIRIYSEGIKDQSNARAALKADPGAMVYRVSLDVDQPGFHGMGLGGRVIERAGLIDGNGALLFSRKPADAPVIHFAGPLEVTFYGEKPVLYLGRDNDLVLVVGTPGRGPGSFAMLEYERTIPRLVTPTAEIAFSAARPGAPPVRKRFKLTARC